MKTYRSKIAIVATTVFTAIMLAAGIASFGPWTAFIFSFGFLGGLLLWLAIPSKAPYASVRWPYLLTLLAFIFLHRVEEYVSKFQEELSKITGHPVPDVTSIALIALLIVSVGAWLLVLPLIKRGIAFGYYLAWTFFASMGITELAHFVFPFFRDEPYGYFPGMASIFILAPLAWWGMYRLWQGRVRR